LLVADPEPRDGHVVGRLVGGQDPEGEVLLAAAFELPGGAHADAVAIQQHAEQGLGVVGGMAAPVVAVLPVEGRQVELVDDVEDEPGEVAFWQPVAQVGWEQEGLVAVAAQEVVGHGAYYRFALFVPNANCFLIVNMRHPDLASGQQPPSRRCCARPPQDRRVTRPKGIRAGFPMAV
jgi:hypothetical protein